MERGYSGGLTEELARGATGPESARVVVAANKKREDNLQPFHTSGKKGFQQNVLGKNTKEK